MFKISHNKIIWHIYSQICNLLLNNKYDSNIVESFENLDWNFVERVQSFKLSEYKISAHL